MASTFADRLWWARHREGLGATKLARLVGCSQSLISSLERRNAERSKLNNKFADALKVDKTWLASGNKDRAPKDFDEAEAKLGRMAMADGEYPSVVRLPPRTIAPVPNAPLAPPTGAGPMAKDIVQMFSEFAEKEGPEKTSKLLETLQSISGLVFHEDESPR